ncbi:MAG: nucleoside kinase [Bacteroidales bacterium]|jgi:uridine kinase|nr:nucleoside kinase [Bacteroidales bacterium]MBR5397487.1 nucleoside kinase [Bacteroidales bacterium]
MDKKEITIFCKNDGKNHKIELGGTLEDLSKKWCRTVIDEKTGQKLDVIAALVDYKLKELEYRPMLFHQVEFIGFNHPDGRRCYLRSLCFVLQNAIRELYPDKVLVVDHSLPSGLYCEIHETTKLEDGRKQSYFVTDDELDMIKEKMKEIIARNLPFKRVKTNSEEAMEIFRRNNQPLKAELQKSIGTFICSVYYLDGNADSFHGPLIPSTGFLKTFDITAIGDGFCLQGPQMTDFNKVMPMKRQAKIGSTLKDHSDWCSIIGIESLGNLNSAIKEGKAIEIINLSEALHERNYAKIADKIKESYKRIVMIAGPSSSGKTSSSLRIALQCKVLGLKPKVIELDNYFVDRDKTPKDEDGKYDFESLYAMDLDLLNSQLNDLLDGKEVEIPKYDFKTGSRTYTGNRLHLEDKDILILEGIHALNPELTSAVDQSKIFRVFASALTSLNIDENNNLSTSDNRLLRRMVRDNRVRGISPEDTILRWNSVRRGESRNIFPYQENADALFNSALIFELPMLKYYAEPLLRRISPSSPAYTETVRLLKFLDYIVALQPSEIEAIPPTSIMREFIGGQTL